MNNIVILDDEFELVKMLKVILEGYDFKVHCFYSAEDFFNSNKHFYMRNGKFVKLTSSEYKIVDSILTSNDKQKSRQEIVADSSNAEITERTIDVHIHSIRKKLVNIDMTIQSVRGFGYKIIFN